MKFDTFNSDLNASLNVFIAVQILIDSFFCVVVPLSGFSFSSGVLHFESVFFSLFLSHVHRESLSEPWFFLYGTLWHS